MNQSRRGFLKSVLGLAVAQAFLPPVRQVSDQTGYYFGSTTGRLSSGKSNIQDLHRVRVFGENRAKTIVAMDFASLEMRVLSAQVAGYCYAARELEVLSAKMFSQQEIDKEFRLVRYNSGESVL